MDYNFTVSITKLKESPSKAIYLANDYPVQIVSRNKTRAYLIGKELFEKLISYIEDVEDRKAVESAKLSESVDYDKVAKKLGI